MKRKTSSKSLIRKHDAAIRSLQREVDLLRLTDRLDTLSARVARLESLQVEAQPRRKAVRS